MESAATIQALPRGLERRPQGLGEAVLDADEGRVSTGPWLYYSTFFRALNFDVPITLAAGRISYALVQGGPEGIVDTVVRLYEITP
jgi:hypothetical protein